MKKNLLILGCIVVSIAIIFCGIQIYKKLTYLNQEKPIKTLVEKIDKTKPKTVKKLPKKVVYLILISKTSVKSFPSNESKEIILLEPFKKVKLIEFNKDKKWLLIEASIDNQTIKGWIPKNKAINFSFFKIKKNTYFKVIEDNTTLRSSPEENYRKLLILNKDQLVKIVKPIIQNNCIPVEVDIDNAVLKGWVEIDKLYIPTLNEKLLKQLSNYDNNTIKIIKRNYLKIVFGYTIKPAVSPVKIETTSTKDNISMKKNNIDNNTQEEKVKIVYFVYLGPFPKYKDIKPLIKKLKENKIEYFISKGKQGYYVHLGTYKEKIYLLALQKQLEQAGIKNAIVKTKMK